jgi:hypothetical protein
MMDNLESGFNAIIHDMSCGLKTHMLNRIDPRQFQNVNLSIEPSHRSSNKIRQNEPYDEFSRVSKMAEVRRLILDHYGPSATLDNFLDGIEIYTSDPDCIKELDEFLAGLRKNCRYYDSLMQLFN